MVDAHLVMVALRFRDTILTGDPDDLHRIADTLGTAGPTIEAWP